MAPTQLQITTSSLQRLIREEASYHKELEQQKQRICKLERGEGEDAEGENKEYLLKQERKALEETKAIFPTLRERIASTREKLESLLDSDENEAEVERAREVLKTAKESQKDDPVG